MLRTTKSNIPEMLRWNLDAASREFNFSAQTLRAALNKNSAVPGDDNCYSTQQICDALFGALHLEKIRTQRQITERITLDNEITRGEVLNRSELAKGFAAIADAIVSRVMAANELSRATKEDLLKDLSSIPVVIADVARKQSQFRDGKNRQVESADEDSL
jgi:hypothetical protein